MGEQELFKNGMVQLMNEGESDAIADYVCVSS